MVKFPYCTCWKSLVNILLEIRFFLSPKKNYNYLGIYRPSAEKRRRIQIQIRNVIVGIFCSAGSVFHGSKKAFGILFWRTVLCSQVSRFRCRSGRCPAAFFDYFQHLFTPKSLFIETFCGAVPGPDCCSSSRLTNLILFLGLPVSPRQCPTTLFDSCIH